jgi:hypothetical protein
LVIVQRGLGLKETQLFVSSSTNLVSIVLIPFDLLIILAQVCSCLKFHLTLDVIPSV